jgi:hypothetical protein
MKNLTKRLLTFALTCAVAVTALVPVTTEAAISYDSTRVIYKSGKSITSVQPYLNISGLTSSQTIKKADISSSKTSVAAPYSIQRNINSYKNEFYEIANSEDYSTDNYYYNIYLLCKKAGTATITFKVTDSKNNKSKTYKTKVTLYNYENPVKAATITGINNGKDLKSKTADQNSVSFTNKSDVKNAQFKITANGDWKIKYINYYKSGETGESRSYYCDSSKTTSKTISLGTLKKNAFAYIYVQFYNTKTNGTVYVYYYLNK